MRRILISAALLLGVTVPMTASGAEAAVPRSSFIVVLQPGTTNVPGVAAGLAASARGELGFVYEDALQGFSIVATDAAAAGLARNPRVAYVERDQEVTLAEVQSTPTGIDRIFATGNTGIDIDATDDFRVDVDVAVIDTGVDFQHPDLNVQFGVNCASGNPFRAKCQGGTNAGDDDHYHGTHVAGTIGALDNGIGVVGVAPGARIHPVKVLNSQGSGYTSWIIAGIDWVAANADVIDVANMSLGGSGVNDSEKAAIQGAVDKGVAFAVAAGNSADDASKYSPAAFDNVLTVSALADFDGKVGGFASSTCRADEDDTLANFSNFGCSGRHRRTWRVHHVDLPDRRGRVRHDQRHQHGQPPRRRGPGVARQQPTSRSRRCGCQRTLYNAVKAAGNDKLDSMIPADGITEPLLDVTHVHARLVPGPGGGGGGGGGDGDTTAPVVVITSPDANDSFSSGSADHVHRNGERRHRRRPDEQPGMDRGQRSYRHGRLAHRDIG